MDSKRFDEITKQLAASADRRAVLKRLAGGALGGLFGLRALEAGATHKPGHHCTPSDQHSCPEGYTCVNKECVKDKPPCSGSGKGCDKTHPCCEGYYCSDKGYCKPVCKTKDQACDEKYPCCDGYYCSDKGYCKPKK